MSQNFGRVSFLHLSNFSLISAQLGVMHKLLRFSRKKLELGSQNFGNFVFELCGVGGEKFFGFRA